jgi:hypothetical protein
MSDTHPTRAGRERRSQQVVEPRRPLARFAEEVVAAVRAQVAAERGRPA